MNELGAAFRNQFGDPDPSSEVFQLWSKELSRFSEAQLIKGFERFKEQDSDFLNLKIFRRLCKPKPEELGLPAIEVAYQAVMARQWEKLHPAFQHIVAEHRYRLRTMSDREGRQLFQKLYREVVERVARGEKFERIQAVEHEPNPSGTIHTKRSGEGRECFKNILADLKGGK